MGIKFTLKDGKGTGKEAEVESTGALLVTDKGIPPVVDKNEVRIFRQHFTLDGESGSDHDMKKTGTSGAPIDFIIKAPVDADRYIESISFVIADQSAVLNKFGNITALVNGVEIFYEDTESGNVIIHEGLTSNFDFIRLCQGNPAIGSTTSSFRASNVEGNSEGYIPVLRFSEVFGIPWGIKLKKSSTLKLVIRIKDDTTGVDKFDAVAYGYDRIV